MRNEMNIPPDPIELRFFALIQGDSPSLRHMRDAKNDEEHASAGLAWGLRNTVTGRYLATEFGAIRIWARRRHAVRDLERWGLAGVYYLASIDLNQRDGRIFYNPAFRYLTKNNLMNER